MIELIFILIAITVVLGFPIALMRVAFTKSSTCPVCEKKLKVINATKCPNCKSVLFKHANGQIHVKN